MNKQTLTPKALQWRTQRTCDCHCTFAQAAFSDHLHWYFSSLPLSFSHSLSKQDVCISVGLPVQSWWSDSVAVECPALPPLWQINWDLRIPFRFPIKPTHRKRQQNTGGHAANSTLPLGRCCLNSETPCSMFYYKLLLSLRSTIAVVQWWI